MTLTKDFNDGILDIKYQNYFQSFTYQFNLDSKRVVPRQANIDYQNSQCAPPKPSTLPLILPTRTMLLILLKVDPPEYLTWDHEGHTEVHVTHNRFVLKH